MILTKNEIISERSADSQLQSIKSCFLKNLYFLRDVSIFTPRHPTRHDLRPIHRVINTELL